MARIGTPSPLLRYRQIRHVRVRAPARAQAASLRWRGSFRVLSPSFTGHGCSCTMPQLNRRRIKCTFHGDHLKRVFPRTICLNDRPPLLFPQCQTIDLQYRANAVAARHQRGEILVNILTVVPNPTDARKKE